MLVCVRAQIITNIALRRDFSEKYFRMLERLSIASTIINSVRSSIGH